MQTLFFKEIHTQRLKLRMLKIKDAYPLSALRSNAQVNRFIARAQTTSMPEALAFIQKMNTAIQAGQSLYWAITQKEDDKLIGTLCLFNISETENSAEVGFELHPDFQQRGIVHEALSALIEFAFTDLKFTSLKAFTMQGNKASVALLKKNGFQPDENRIESAEGNSGKYELMLTLKREK